jgi:alpha-galactosidase
MGWNSWNKFACNVSEDLIKGIADAMVTSGMKDAGYEYVNVDDCWQVSRAADGTIVADATRFKSGMKALADYVHGKGLKFGLYSDRGTLTCQKRPGAQGYERKDAETYAAWGVDYLKHDNCNVNLDMQTQYRLMRTELDRATTGGRPIVLSICAWKFEPWMPEVGQLWRTTDDIEDKWMGGSRGMLTILDQNSVLSQYAKPGHWNDPDMLEVGNGGMSDAEYRAHFSLWAMMAAPLIAGNDLRNMSEATKTILLNKDVIAVDQDTLGIQGKPIRTSGDQQVWTKKLCGSQTYAVLMFNRGGAPADMTVTWAEVGLTSTSATVRDLWSHTDLGSTATQYKATVPSHGVVMLRVAGI